MLLLLYFYKTADQFVCSCLKQKQFNKKKASTNLFIKLLFFVFPKCKKNILFCLTWNEEKNSDESLKSNSLLLILLTFFCFVSMVSFKKTLKAFSCLQLLEKDQSWKTSGKQKTWLSWVFFFLFSLVFVCKSQEDCTFCLYVAYSRWTEFMTLT